MERLGHRREFGRLPGGETVEAISIGAGNLTADILSWGAVVHDLRFDGRNWPLVLGFDSIGDYLEHSRFFGATAGRYANRIADGRFELEGQTYQLERNFLDRHHLHGGSMSFGLRLWDIVAASDNAVTLALESPDGEGGYPGAVNVTCIMSVEPPATLVIRYEGTTSAPTILNLAHHSYFNLDGSPDILNHKLKIDAETFLPVNETLIPTGEIRPVEGTMFDFRESRRIRDPALPITLYDHNFCLAGEQSAEPDVCAVLEGERGLSMTLKTTEPGLQFYDGSTLDVPVPGLDGRAYGAHAGLCLEPQRWPDSPNRPKFTDATLRPGETYRQTSLFEFSE